MDTKYYIGRLKRWDDSKGFGFIQSEAGGQDTFIHISCLKGCSRRPKAGDKIIYQRYTDREGKVKAVNAKIEGVSRVRPRAQVVSPQVNSQRSWGIMLLVFLVLMGFLAYKATFVEKTEPGNYGALLLSPDKEFSKQKYSCKGKRFCSEMISCEEAQFYLKSCSGTQIDGDGDGVPCESQWCSW